MLIVGVQNLLLQNNTHINSQSNAKGGAIAMLQNTNVQVINCTFDSNFSNEKGAAIAIEFLGFFQLNNSTFKNCVAQDSGGAFFINMGVALVFQNSNFTSNQALQGQGGAIYWNMGNQLNYSNTILFTNLNFESNIAQEGGAIQIQYFNTIQNYNLIQYCNFFNNKALSGSGGAISIYKIQQKIILQNLLFVNNTSSHHGGGIVIQKSIVDVKNSNFIDNQAEGQGGGLSIYNEIANSEYSSLNFTQNEAKNGGGFSIFNSQNITIFNLQLLSNLANDIGGAMYLTNSQNISISKVDIINNSAQQAGGIYLVKNILINIQSSLIKQNEAQIMTGGILTLNSKNITLNNTKIIENTSYQQNAAIYGQMIENYFLYNLQIIDNYAESSIGGIYLEFIQNFNFENITLDNNYQGGFYMLQATYININNITVLNNYKINSLSGGFQLTQCFNVLLNQVEFYNNTSSEGGAISFVSSQNMTIQNIIITDNYADKIGGGVYIDLSKNVTFTNLTINQNQAQNQAGAFFIQNSTDIQIIQIQMLENQVNLQGGTGGAIVVQYDSYDIILQDIQIQDNQCMSYGGAIYIYSINNIKIINAQIHNNTGYLRGQAIYAQDLELLQLQSVEIDNLKTEQYLVNLGGGLYLQNINEVNLAEIDIQNTLSKIQGAGAYLYNVEKIIINKSFFKNCIVNKQSNYNYGGAIYIENSQNLNLYYSNFLQNFAYYKGGGVFLKNVNLIYIYDTLFRENQVFLNENTYLYQKDKKYLLTQGGNIYIEGDNIKQVNIDLTNNTFDSGKASSGGGLFIDINPKSEIQQLQFSNNIFSNNQADIGPALRIIGIDENNKYNQKILKNIQEELKAYASEKNVQLIDDIYLGQNSDKNYQGGVINYVYNEKLQNSLSSAKFSLCNKGTYSENGGDDNCVQCLQNAECSGGYIPIFPQKEYWRNTTESLYTLYECDKNQEACQGNDTCQIGYRGIKCEKCDRKNNYTQSNNTCKKCGNQQSMFSQSIECLIPYRGEQDYSTLNQLLSLFALLVMAIIVIVIVLIEYLFYLKKTIIIQKQQFLDYVYLSILIFSLFCQPSIFTNSLSFVNCRKIGENKYSQADIDINCSSDYFTNQVLPLNVSIIILTDEKYQNVDQQYPKLIELQQVPNFEVEQNNKAIQTQAKKRFTGYQDNIELKSPQTNKSSKSYGFTSFLSTNRMLMPQLSSKQNSPIIKNFVGDLNEDILFDVNTDNQKY
ncbi:Pectin lyase fold/virulence factor [Pseudocohnilembus persalinus]|uniref:Pectin lyase fold/virulence factor n=1 Tax=Pseudocohnilembus persalinus TaxID=266149 RepID=A0A0V0R7M4_PSEPJ|nr:Pectin lyase fold/virulence factor [Pseudocohnilembus persalinus]|eukprot:KRX10495.1 Pectin lyase fold/virulence factor [Pseudocohnilembus persalinus]